MSSNHYVDNKKFLECIIDYKKRVKEAEEQGTEKPRIPEYAGKAILLIANGLASKASFAPFFYTEEMVGDGIENCITYFDNFDPEKTSNPFAYFTQIVYFAFLRRIEKERKELYVKYKVALKNLVFEELAEYTDGDDLASPTFDIDQEVMSDFIKDFEGKLAKKRAARKQGALDKFLEKEGEIDEDSTD